jgi:membrane protein insertase Oxa1/YidC/SpoIIIJ
MPLALGIYWLIGSLFSLLQQLLTRNLLKKDEELLKLSKGGM